MTIFNVEPKKYWFDIEGGGRICLRPLTVEDWKEIRKKTAQKKEVFKVVNGQMQRVAWEEEDEDKQNEFFWDRVIVDWENFVDVNKKPIPCNKKTKMLLFTRSLKFVQMVTELFNKMMEEEAKRQEEIEKN